MSGETLWQAPNAGATNESGFHGVPGGFLTQNGIAKREGEEARYWLFNNFESKIFLLYTISTAARIGVAAEDEDFGTGSRQFGAYIRCLEE